MASAQQAGGMPPALALLHAIARHDLPAVQAALAGGCKLNWKGVSALHMCAFCNWADPIPLLLARGARLDVAVGAGELAFLSNDVIVARLQAVGAPEDLCAAALPLHEHKTPLALAACCGSEAVIAALVSAGVRKQQAQQAQQQQPQLQLQQAQQQQQQQADAAFRKLEELARQQARALQPEAAATAVPAVVQRCAVALLAGGHAGRQAHAAAVRLALPSAKSPLLPSRLAQHGGATSDSSFPPCPWLLQQLLQRHQAGQVPAAADAVFAVCDALLCCAKQCGKQGQHGAAQRRKLDEMLAAWLRLPAAGELEGSILAALLERACKAGLTKGLPALLALAPLQAELRAEAAAPIAVEEHHSDSKHAVLVCAAASSGSGAVLDSVLAAGGAVTLNAINQAAATAACARRSEQRALRALQLLLRRGHPPVPTDVAALASRPDGATLAELCHRLCPIYNLLCVFSSEMDELVEELVEQADSSGIDPDEEPLHALHKRALAVMDALADAGYRPSTFTNCPHRGPPHMPQPPGEPPQLQIFYPPDNASLVASWELRTSARWLWLAAQRLPWSPEAHATFPPAFKEAARTLLLAAHRGATLAASDASGAAGAGDGAAAAGDRSAGSSDGAAGAGGSAAGAGGSAAGAGDSKAGAGALHLGCLPRELLHGILAHAAYPLSEWAPQMEDGSWLEEVQAWEPLDSEGAYDDGYGYGDGDDSDSDFW